MDKKKYDLQIETNLEEHDSEGSQEFKNQDDSFEMQIQNQFIKISEKNEEEEILRNYKKSNRQSMKRITTMAKVLDKQQMHINANIQLHQQYSQKQQIKPNHNFNFEKSEDFLNEYELRDQIDNHQQYISAFLAKYFYDSIDLKSIKFDENDLQQLKQFLQLIQLLLDDFQNDILTDYSNFNKQKSQLADAVDIIEKYEIKIKILEKLILSNQNAKQEENENVYQREKTIVKKVNQNKQEDFGEQEQYIQELLKRISELESKVKDSDFNFDLKNQEYQDDLLKLSQQIELKDQEIHKIKKQILQYEQLQKQKTLEFQQQLQNQELELKLKIQESDSYFLKNQQLQQKFNIIEDNLKKSIQNTEDLNNQNSKFSKQIKKLEKQLLKQNEMIDSFIQIQQQLANQWSGDKNKIFVSKDVIQQAFETINAKNKLSDREKFKASIKQSDFLKDQAKEKFQLQQKKDALIELLQVIKITIQTRQQQIGIQTRTAKIFFHNDLKNTAILIAENIPLYTVVSQLAHGLQGYGDEEQFEIQNGQKIIQEPLFKEFIFINLDNRDSSQKGRSWANSIIDSQNNQCSFQQDVIYRINDQEDSNQIMNESQIQKNSIDEIQMREEYEERYIQQKEVQIQELNQSYFSNLNRSIGNIDGRSKQDLYYNNSPFIQSNKLFEQENHLDKSENELNRFLNNHLSQKSDRMEEYKSSPLISNQIVENIKQSFALKIPQNIQEEDHEYTDRYEKSSRLKKDKQTWVTEEKLNQKIDNEFQYNFKDYEKISLQINPIIRQVGQYLSQELIPLGHLSINSNYEDPLFNEKTIHEVEFFMPSQQINSRTKDPTNVSFSEHFQENFQHQQIQQRMQVQAQQPEGCLSECKIQ